MADEAGGFVLFLFESFAARALLGSLVAALLVQSLLRRNAVCGVHARRLLLLVPFVVAAALAAASASVGFLPAVWFDTDRIAAAGTLIEVLGDIQSIGGTVNLVAAAYGLALSALLTRRVFGLLATARLRTASAVAPPAIRRRALRVALASDVVPPEVRVLRACPGGAFTAGLRRPWIALDPELVEMLDDGELDGLLAHEMAHIRRRDPLLSLLTGICRDVVFFLPGIHLATVSLRREQEEEADDLAAGSTHKPAALASTILKVWEAQAGRPRLITACAAVAPAGAVLARAAGWRRRRTGEQPHVLVRVQRLISPSTVRHEPLQRRELGLPLTVLTVAVTVGVLVPAWLTHVFNNDGVLVSVLSAPAVAQVESPAFATFRALAPRQTTRPAPTATTTDGDDDALCPCVESPAQLRAGRSAGTATATSQLVWSSDGRDAWELQRIHEQARLRAGQKLISWHGAEREVGFFTVSRTPVTAAP